MAKKKTDNAVYSIEECIAEITKEHGELAIVCASSDKRVNVATIPSGSLALDKAIGVGGIPKGRITEIYGPESSGKTTICIHAIANVQKAGGKAAIVDTEHALDLQYCKMLGVDLDRLMVSQPDCGEDAIDIAEKLIRMGVDIVVVDSVAALVPRAEIEGDAGDAHMGLQARLMSQAMRKLTGITKKRDVALIFTNQIRSKIGITFGSPEVTAGGNALKFYASVRLDIRRIGSDKNKDGEAIRNRVRIKVVKNKLAPPFRVAETSILFGKGFDLNKELFDICIEEKVIRKKGSWFDYDGTTLGQGQEAVLSYFEENVEFRDSLLEYVYNMDDESEEVDEETRAKIEELEAKIEKYTEKIANAKDSELTIKYEKRVSKYYKQIAELEGSENAEEE